MLNMSGIFGNTSGENLEATFEPKLAICSLVVAGILSSAALANASLLTAAGPLNPGKLVGVSNSGTLSLCPTFATFLGFNGLLEASNLSEAELEKLFIGEKIPEMRFMAQDNDDTFDNVNTRFYVNNENTAVGMDDPYRFYSNVDNYWQTEPDSMLFTVNP